MKIFEINKHQVLCDDDFAEQNKKISIAKNRNKFYARYGKIYLHRLVTQAKAGEIVDHINGNGLDNRKENLRIASPQMNRVNCDRKNCTSKYAGVSVEGKRIRVQMKINGKIKHFSKFQSEAEAAFFYDRKCKELYGNKALLNFDLNL